MRLIFGLGNPGDNYTYTRHNAGFIILDKLQKTEHFPLFKFNSKFNAKLSSGELEGEKSLLIKPQTFMNLSGKTVQSVLAFYKLTLDDIIVIHDDLDIPFGNYKISDNSSSAGHNGIQNIIDLLGSQKFKRIRIGIGKPPEEKKTCLISGKDYVLQKFSPSELTTLTELFPAILTTIKNF